MRNLCNHHLLEIILWPESDGTLREILNTASRLKELGIYTDKLTIPCTRADHSRLHASGRVGIKRSAEARKRLSESARRSVERGGHRGGIKFKGMKWKVVNNKRVWHKEDIHV